MRAGGRHLWFPVVLGFLLGGGCGYTLIGGEAARLGERKALAVEPFTNQTRMVGLERHVTATLRHAILQSRAFYLASAATSSTHLQGVIRAFRSIPISFDTTDAVLQYRLEADVEVRLLDGSSRPPLMAQEITVWAEYLVSKSGNVRENVVAREAAIARLAQRFADQCVALLEVVLAVG